MPELPEVEVTRLSFADRIRGAEVTAVRVGKPLRWPLGVEPEQIVAQKVGPVTRRGKYLWLALDRGGLLMHLGMSGSLSFAHEPAAPGPHDHFDLVTANGTLRLTDPRRFGAVVWSPAIDAGAAAKLLAGLGVEPFDPAFHRRPPAQALRRRRVAVKTALLGGDIVVGAGNIYACEALFEAGIDPRTRSDRLSRARCEPSPRRCGGRSRAPSKAADRPCATFAMHTAWPARSSCRRGSTVVREAVPRCGATIRRIVQGQRATFFCPGCQRR
jgi:formamidopyrimidine-DNA glycosylase